MTKQLIIKHIDLNKINLSPMQNLNTKKIIKLLYENNRFLIQTPELFFINNIITKNNITEFLVPLSCIFSDKNPLLVNFFKQIDQYLIKSGQLNIKKWFNENDSNIKYKSIIRTNTENCLYKNGAIKIKFNNNNKNLKILYNNNIINNNNIKSGLPLKSKVKLVFELYIWINNIGYGILIKPLLLSFKDIENISLIEDSDDDNDNDNDIDILDTEIEI